MFSFGLVILLFIGMVLQHKKDNGYFLELNGFYNCLDDLDEEMYNGLVTGNIEWTENLDDKLNEMNQMLHHLKRWIQEKDSREIFVI